MRRAARLIVLYLLEAVAALLALFILLGGAVLWRLAEGPVDADLLKPTAINALVNAVDGETAEVGALQLRFDPRDATLIVTATDVRVRREGGGVILAAEQISAGLALDLLLAGRTSPVSLTARGGRFSVLRTLQGRVIAGLGDPRGLNREAEDVQAEAPSLGALTSELDRAGGGLLARLQRLDLQAVDLRLVDEASELEWFISGASLDVDLQGDQVRADVSGALITSAGPAPIAVRVDSARDLDTVFAEISLTDFVPAAAAPRRGVFAAMSGLEGSFDIRLVFDASVEVGLRTALFDISSSAGEIRLDDTVFPFRESGVRLEYDAPSGAIQFQQVDIQSDLLELELAGRIYDLGGFVGAIPTQARFELVADQGRLNLAGVFPDAQAWTSAVLAGRLDTQAQVISFEQLDLNLPYATGRLTGRLALEDVGDRRLPSLQLAGAIEGEIGKREVLRHWPVDFALGARDWVRDSILDGRLFNARLDLDIPASAIAARELTDDALSLVFEFVDADVRYVSTMTPLLGLSGEAELRGNSLSLSGADGAIGDLAIDTIFVEIPRLNPKGAIARFGGSGTGGVRPVLELLSEPPLLIADTYGLDPDLFDGAGAMTFEIRRPMRRFVPVQDIGYQIDGQFDEVRAPTGVEGVDLEGGSVVITANPDGLAAQGVARLAGADISVDWTETFGLEGAEPSTRVLASGTMTGRGLDQLGLPVRRFMDGAVDVTAELAGRGFDFSSIDVGLDLSAAAVVLPADIWEKPVGAPGRAQFGIEVDEGGALRLDPLVIEAEGIDLIATASVGADGRLLAAQVERLTAPGRLDVSLVADRPQGSDGPLRMALSGGYLDAGELFSVTAPGGGPFVTAPLILEADIERVLVRDVSYRDVTLSALIGPDGIGSAGLLALRPDGATGLLVDYSADPDNVDQRVLTVRSDDAGQLLTAFAGFSNVSGGQLRLDAITPVVGAEGSMSGRVEVDDFTLERLPLLARILAVGSLEGLGGLLSGEGIQFDRLETDFTWSSGVLGMEDARAAGPSLGATWQGVVSFEDSRVNVDGTLLPSYGANSILGGLPLLGELLTSRRGEGVFGVTFSVAGPFDETRVVANPLAAFAPGVFRRVFEGTAAEEELDALRERSAAAQAETAPGAEPPNDTPAVEPGDPDGGQGP